MAFFEVSHQASGLGFGTHRQGNHRHNYMFNEYAGPRVWSGDRGYYGYGGGWNNNWNHGWNRNYGNHCYGNRGFIGVDFGNLTPGWGNNRSNGRYSDYTVQPEQEFRGPSKEYLADAIREAQAQYNYDYAKNYGDRAWKKDAKYDLKSLGTDFVKDTDFWAATNNMGKLPVAGSQQDIDALDAAYRATQGNPRRLAQLDNAWRNSGSEPGEIAHSMNSLLVSWGRSPSSGRGYNGGGAKDVITDVTDHGASYAHNGVNPPKAIALSEDDHLQALFDGQGANDRAHILEIGRSLTDKGVIRPQDLEGLREIVSQKDGFVGTAQAAELVNAIKSGASKQEIQAALVAAADLRTGRDDKSNMAAIDQAMQTLAGNMSDRGGQDAQQLAQNDSGRTRFGAPGKN